MNTNNSSNNKSFFKNFSSVVIKDQPIPGYSNSEIILVSINHTGTRLVNSRTDKSLRIWKCVPDRLIEPIVIENAHSKAVECISWNPKTDYTFASVGRDDSIKIWKGFHGTLEKEIKVVKDISNQPATCHLVKYSADGEILSVVDRDSTITFYSVTNNYKKVKEIKLHEHIYQFTWFNHNHSFFMCALHDGSIPVYKIDLAKEEFAQLKTTLTGHRSSVTCISLDPKGHYFAVGSNEGVVSIWNTASMLNNRIIADIDEPVSNIDISRDGAYIAVAYDNTNIRIFDLETTEEVFEIPNSTNGKLVLASISWFPNKTSFVCTNDGARNMILMKKPDK